MNATETIKEAIRISDKKFQGNTKYHHQNIVNAIGCFGEIYGWEKNISAYTKFIDLCCLELPKVTKPAGYKNITGSNSENVANYVNYFGADKIEELRNR